MTEMHAMPAAELVRAYRDRKMTPVDVTGALLQRIERLNPALNALYLVDPESAMESARESERRWWRRAPAGPLDGVPTTIKDALAARGWPAYRGSAARTVGAPLAESDAPVVARMREGGMILLGKTIMCDFGMLPSGYSSLHGPVRNPWNTERTPGGSSAGAAAAVAAGLNPVAVGTDIVGSIRLPASFSGVFGLKPSQGRVPYYFPNSPALVAGPLSWTVEDAALLMNVIARPDTLDFTALARDSTDYVSALSRPMAGARVALLEGIGFGPDPDPDVVAALHQTARLLEACGCRVTRIASPFQPGDARAAEDFYRVRCYTEFMALSAAERGGAAVIEGWTRPAGDLSARDLYRCMNAMQQLREQAVRLIEGYDFLMLPSVPVPAYAAELPGPTEDDMFAGWCNTFLFNLTEQPGSSVPAGLSSAGLPIGVQLVGQRFDDVGVMALSATFERASGGFQRPPESIFA